MFRPLGITGQGSAYQRPFFWHNTHLAECMPTLNLKQACIVILIFQVFITAANPPAKKKKRGVLCTSVATKTDLQ